MSKHESLQAALAAFQADLPKVGKNSVNPHFKSKFASLEDITEVVLPALGAQGLSWVTRPVVDVDRGFVLRFELLHEAGERIAGEWPLPAGAQPQAMGSALTYARRYTLCAVTGVAPDEDDDGNAAQQVRQPQPPDGWRRAVEAATTVEYLNSVFQQATSEGWMSPAVKQALTARKTQLEAGDRGDANA